LARAVSSSHSYGTSEKTYGTSHSYGALRLTIDEQPLPKALARTLQLPLMRSKAAVDLISDVDRLLSLVRVLRSLVHLYAQCS
jgi:hypothetical protein